MVNVESDEDRVEPLCFQISKEGAMENNENSLL
jgi:hypothetical protein